MSPPLFSVVCPAYNAERTIAAALRSVLGQTCEDFELIVVDDGSVDGTAGRVHALAAGDSRIRLRQQPNSGPAAARNRGFSEASGALVSIIDSDDLWLPGYLDAAAAALSSQPEAGLCFCGIWVLDDRTRRVHRETFELSQTDQSRYIPAGRLQVELLRDNFIPASAVTITRDALEQSGGFDESLRLSEDWDLWLRVAHAGFGAVQTPSALAVGRNHPGSISNDSLGMARSANLVARRAAERSPEDPEVTTAAAAVIDLTDRDIAERTDAPWPHRARATIRRRLSAAKYRVLRRREWHEPPPQLARFLDQNDPQADP